MFVEAHRNMFLGQALGVHSLEIVAHSQGTRVLKA